MTVFFSDNSDPNGDFGVIIKVSVIKYKLRIGLLGSVKGRYEFAEDLVKNGDQITVPLGAHFTLSQVDAINGGVVPSIALHGDDPSPTGDISPDALYKDQVLLFMNKNKPIKEFLAVHLGSQIVSLFDPNDDLNDPNTRPLLRFVVKVVRPAALGMKDFACGQAQCDEIIITAANKYGIPPQFIKATIKKESDFKPKAYRYEPDFDLKHSNFYRRKNSFKPYVLFDEERNPVNEVIEPRGSRYKAIVNGLRQFIPLDYEYIAGLEVEPPDAYKALSVDELLVANNIVSVFGYLPHLQPISNYRFTAQTVIASSYGLMQVMYPTAVESGFQGSPISIFNPILGINVGARILVNKFKVVNTLDAIQNVENVEDFLVLMSKMHQAYNGKMGTAKTKDYAAHVLKLRLEYYPRISSEIFNNEH